MLREQLIEQTKRMNNLKQLRDTAQDKAQQEKNYNDLNMAANELSINVQKMKAAQDTFGIKFDDEVYEYILDVSTKLKETYVNSFIDADQLRSVRALIRNKVVQILAKNWKDYYYKITQRIFGNLNTIEGLLDDKDKLNEIRTALNNGAEWTTLNIVDTNQKDRLANLKNAIDDFEIIVDSLNLKEGVSFFLNKVTKGNATVSDLNNEIMDWIKEENLMTNKNVLH